MFHIIHFYYYQMDQNMYRNLYNSINSNYSYLNYYTNSSYNNYSTISQENFYSIKDDIIKYINK